MITLTILMMKACFYIVFGGFILMWKLFKELMWILLFLIGFWII